MIIILRLDSILDLMDDWFFGNCAYFVIFISWNFDEFFGDSFVDIKRIYNMLKNVIQILNLTLLILSVELIIQVIETVFSIQIF